MRILALVLWFVTACGGGIDAKEDAARAALSDAKYGEAIAQSNEGIKIAVDSQNRPAQWRFELIIVEAMAKSGQGLAVVTELQRLAEAFPKQVNAKLYLSLGSHAKEAGDNNGAIELWAAGDKRFPDQSAQFKAAIDSLQKAGDLAPAELEKLKSLGYIQ